MVRLLLIGIVLVILALVKKGPGYKLVISMAITTIAIVAVGAFLVPGTKVSVEDRSGKPPPQLEQEKSKRIERSNRAYVDGLKAMNRKDYSAAIQFLIQVVPEDENYREAQTVLKKAELERNGQMVAEGRSRMEEGDYESALRIFEKILAYNPGFLEAKELKAQAEQKLNDRFLRQAEKSVPIDWVTSAKRMTEWDYGSGTIGIAVNQTRVSSLVKTDFGFHYEARDNDGQYVWLLVSAINIGGTSVSVSADDFTLSVIDGGMISRNEATFSQEHFKTVNLAPNNTAKGWIIFFMPKRSQYILRYHGPGGLVEKGIVL